MALARRDDGAERDSVTEGQRCLGPKIGPLCREPRLSRVAPALFIDFIFSVSVFFAPCHS